MSLSDNSYAAFGNNDTRTCIDFGKLRMIWNYYYRKENWIIVCNNILNEFIFDGGMNISFGKVRKMDLTDKDQSELRALHQRALDYKRMFGFVPVKFIKKKDSDTDFDVPSIPEFGTVDFYVKVDPKSLQLSMYYTEKNANDKHVKENPVYIWPGLEPDINGEIKSPMLLLLKRYLIYLEFEQNALDADFNASRPTVFLKSMAEKVSSYDITETELFADYDDPAIDPSMVKTYKRDTFRAMLLEKRQQDLSADTTGTRKRRRIDDDTGYMKDEKRKW